MSVKVARFETLTTEPSKITVCWDVYCLLILNEESAVDLDNYLRKRKPTVPCS
jgi:hypothetical protein